MSQRKTKKQAREPGALPAKTHCPQGSQHGAHPMHLPLYKALLAANISDEAATALVQAMDAHIESRVTAATQPVLSKLESMQTTLSLQIGTLKEEKATAEKVKEARIKNWQWAAGWAVGGAGVAITALKAFGLI